MEMLWKPGQIGPMSVKNRTIRSATNEHLATREGVLTDAWTQTYFELATGGVGTIITGHFAVDITQRADEGQPVIDEEMEQDLLRRSCDQLSRVCQEVHRNAAKLIIQISHTGPKAPPAVNGHPAKYPVDFSEAEMKKLMKQFTFTAKTCQACGADGVQVHMAHGYLLSSFLNPEGNLRSDEYGGSLENRFRLPGEIIRAVREACGADFAVMVKADCNGTGDLHGLLRLCKQAGVDCVEVSGVDFAMRAGVKEPFYLQEVLEAREGIDLPVALVGGVFSLDDARRVMDARIEFVSFCRALICEPDFIGKLRGGEKERSACLACNGCYKVYRQRPVRCVCHQQPIPQLEQVFGPYEK